MNFLKKEKIIHDIFVIDNSISMEQGYYTILKKTIKKRRFGQIENRITIITTNATSTNLILQDGTPNWVTNSFPEIEIHYGTNFSNGIEMALNVIKTYKNHNIDFRLFLLTDGEFETFDLEATNSFLAKMAKNKIETYTYSLGDNNIKYIENFNDTIILNQIDDSFEEPTIAPPTYDTVKIVKFISIIGIALTILYLFLNNEPIESKEKKYITLNELSQSKLLNVKSADVVILKDKFSEKDALSKYAPTSITDSNIIRNLIYKLNPQLKTKNAQKSTLFYLPNLKFALLDTAVEYEHYETLYSLQKKGKLKLKSIKHENKK